jgi:hypothetical protein
LWLERAGGDAGGAPRPVRPAILDERALLIQVRRPAGKILVGGKLNSL